MNDEAYNVLLPRKFPNRVTIYATSSDVDVSERLRRLLQEQGTVPKPFHDNLKVSCTSDQLPHLSALWSREFDRGELEQITCRLVASSAEPSLSELMQTQTLGGLTDWIEGRWLIDLIRSRRLVTYFQPIVNNVTPEDVFAYECLIRAIDEAGKVILPNRLFSAARATGLLQTLDQAARLTAIAAATEQGLDTCVFVNFNPRFITTLKHFERTLRAVEASNIPNNRFVFEVVESDQISDPNGLLRILDYCRDAGCRVALDDLGAGYSSLNLMSIVKPDFVKLDIGLIRDVDSDYYKSCVANKLLELARELGVATVAEGVETYAEWMWAKEHGADFSQGFLFSRPEAVPPGSCVPSASKDLCQLACDTDSAADFVLSSSKCLP